MGDIVSGGILYELLLVSVDGGMGDYGLIGKDISFGVCGRKLLMDGGDGIISEGGDSIIFYNLYIIEPIDNMDGLVVGDYYLNNYGNEYKFGDGDLFWDFGGFKKIVAKTGFRGGGVLGISKDFVRKYIDYYNGGITINYVGLESRDGLIISDGGEVVIMDNLLYNKGLYNNKDVRALFEKFMKDRSCYYAEDVDNIMPLDKWLDDNVL